MDALSSHDFDWKWACDSSKARILDGGIGLLELKNFGATWRIACYLSRQRGDKFVVLEAFRAHSGTNRIPPDVMKKLRNLAKATKDLDDNGEIPWV